METSSGSAKHVGKPIREAREKKNNNIGVVKGKVMEWLYCGMNPVLISETKAYFCACSSEQ